MAKKNGDVKLTAKLYRGMPNVELSEGDLEGIREELAPGRERHEPDPEEAPRIKISLKSLEIDLQHNQSFGMVSASTGCVSNPGGPGC
jgi:hypothetical protein